MLSLTPHPFGALQPSTRVPLDEEAVATLLSAADDAWSDLRSAHPDPFLDDEQGRCLLRALPWLAVERAVGAYMGFVQSLAALDSRGVFSSSANRVRWGDCPVFLHSCPPLFFSHEGTRQSEERV